MPHQALRKTGLMLLAILIIISATTAASSFWISGKAVIAQHLLHAAWQSSLESGQGARPWPWADTTTVARLSVPAVDESMIVLDGSHGEALAFGPGKISFQPHRAGGNEPGSNPLSRVNLMAIGGHRDTHLAFLEHLKPGDELLVETLDGKSTRYQLQQAQIVDTRHETLMSDPGSPGLLLITCYPFNATQTGGPLRYVAMARMVGEM